MAPVAGSFSTARQKAMVGIPLAISGKRVLRKATALGYSWCLGGVGEFPPLGSRSMLEELRMSYCAYFFGIACRADGG